MSLQPRLLVWNRYTPRTIAADCDREYELVVTVGWADATCPDGAYCGQHSRQLSFAPHCARLILAGVEVAASAAEPRTKRETTAPSRPRIVGLRESTRVLL